MLSSYPACFFKEETGYSVIFPDLNGLSTCGDTLDEALEMAIDCLAGYLYTGKKDGDVIPPPSALDQISAQKLAEELDVEAEGSFVNLVSVDVDDYANARFEKLVKKTLTIPAWLNNAAMEKGINFSQTLKNALMEQMGINQ